MMDINRIVRDATINVFSNLIDEGYLPNLEFDDNSFTLCTEDSSEKIAMIIDRKRTGFGEHVFSLQVIPGEGETYVAEMVADEIARLIRASNDE